MTNATQMCELSQLRSSIEFKNFRISKNTLTVRVTFYNLTSLLPSGGENTSKNLIRARIIRLKNSIEFDKRIKSKLALRSFLLTIFRFDCCQSWIQALNHQSYHLRNRRLNPFRIYDTLYTMDDDV